MDVPKDQFSTLLEHGLYSSAQIIGCFAVSSTSINPETSPHLRAESLVQFGDALFREKEYRRAIQAYKQALQYHKIIPKQSAVTPPTTRSSLSASNRSSSPNSASISGLNENEVKFKIAKCHSSLSENRAALAEMEGIPSKSRNLEMNLMMAKLYRNSRHTRSAIGCYKECLRHCPFIIEAIIALAELGIAAKDIISLFPQTPNRSGRPPFDHFDSSRWLQRYVEAQCCIVSNDYKGGLELFTELLQRFPNNIHILLEMAKPVIGKNDEAILDFEKVRSIDPYVVTYMDEYAMLLKLKSDNSKLNKLVHDLLSVDPTRPEVFVALSVLWEKKNDERGALSYVEKSIRIDERHVAGYIMKGNLFLSMNQPEAAVIAYRGAQELRPDLRSYQGLVRSYLALTKIKEALHAAREAMKAMPQSAKALKLVGDVHASSTSGREKAKKFYESALRLEPGFLGAALALAELHVMEGRNGDAATNMLQEALSHYQAALRINVQNEAAKKGLERLEKQMKGVDPDAPEEDEDNEVDDADGDQEEAELL
ncbi:Anaphase-promoting complex subunit 7 [Abeliophyllum distichum]|uniref:Anaphase-promoting complex subunit 7 n=1 Tax=Abeliophyllum distichum TaxID=126358 RepID=A0ABD1T1Y7_9LAMI